MVIVILTLNQTNVQFVVKVFEKTLKPVTMEIKETAKDVLQIVNQYFQDGLVQEDHQQASMFAKNVETVFLKELKFVMTTILHLETVVIQAAIKNLDLIVLGSLELVYLFAETVN